MEIWGCSRWGWHPFPWPMQGQAVIILEHNALKSIYLSDDHILPFITSTNYQLLAFKIDLLVLFIVPHFSLRNSARIGFSGTRVLRYLNHWLCNMAIISNHCCENRSWCHRYPHKCKQKSKTIQGNGGTQPFYKTCTIHCVLL